MSPLVEPIPAGQERLFAKDIASQFRISEWTARRWLRELEGTHGATVVGRVGNGAQKAQRFTTRAALARVQPLSGPTGQEMSDRMGCLEDQLRNAQRIIADLVSRVGRLER